MPFDYALAEKQRHEALQYVADQTKYAVYLNDATDNPSIWERQLGHPYTSVDFEARLRKLNPNLIFEHHPYKPDKKCLYHVNRLGKHFICAYENGYAPEHSVMRTRTEEVWTGQTHIIKKDLPKGEFVPGKGFIWDSRVTPGFKEVEVPWGEAIRGWRTVLIKLVGNLIVTVSEVERVFGADDTAEWKKHTGKGVTSIPW